MGVKFGDIVTKKQLSFEDLMNKAVAVDFSNSAYQFLASIRQPDGTPLLDSQGRITSHLMGTWNRFSNLVQQGIRLVIVFDGKMPALKHGTNVSRSERKDIARELYEEAKQAGNTEEMTKYAKQFSRLTKEMAEESKELVEAMGIPYVQAPAEADAQMAYLAKKGDVWATASSDFDSLLHGSPRMVTNLTLSQRRKTPTGAVIKTFPELIELEDVLSTLNVTLEQLIIVAILSGTDYNPGGIKGIGPKKALKIVREHKDYDKMFKELNADFDWKKIISLFKKMNVKKDYKLAWKQPDPKKIKKILVDEHNFSEQRVSSVIQKLQESNKKKAQTGLSNWI